MARNMPGYVCLFFLLALLMVPADGLAVSARIIVDGEFADWGAIPRLATDPMGDFGDGKTDFVGLSAANDERFLVVNLEAVPLSNPDEAYEFGLQVGGYRDIRLMLDTDNDPATGLEVHGIGAELVWEFGARQGTFYGPSGTVHIYHEHIGLVIAPAMNSTRWEIALDRSALPDGYTPLFPGPTVNVVFDDAYGMDVMPDADGGVTYDFDDTPLDPLPSISLAREDDTHLRLLTHNVLHGSPFEAGRKPYYRRILNAVRPDIIAFQEIWDQSARLTKALVEDLLPLPGADRWYAEKVENGIVLVSRFPISEHFQIPGASNDDGNGAFILDLSPDYECELLVINAHLPCCFSDPERQKEADILMAFLRDAKAQSGVLHLEQDTPFIITGDMNLVGSRRQLVTLLTGDIATNDNGGWQHGDDFQPDWDGSDLEQAFPRLTHRPMKFTWYNDLDPYCPGKLDYVIYSGSVLDLANTFVAFTPAMPAETLAEYGLYPEDTVYASDHLPVVADFAIPVVTPPEVEIHCINVGHGDCTLVISSTGGTCLIDAGDESKGWNVVVPYLDRLGLETLDYICTSNYSSEHIGGMDEVVDHFGIDNINASVLDRGQTYPSYAFNKYLQRVAPKRQTIVEGQVIDLGGGVTITCVGVNGASTLGDHGIRRPPPGRRHDWRLEGANSVALVVEYGDFQFFVGGDLTGSDQWYHRDVETPLGPKVGDIDVYQVNNHGHKYSSNMKFIAALSPEVSIFPVGRRGKRHSPSLEVVQRLDEARSDIYMTERPKGFHWVNDWWHQGWGKGKYDGSGDIVIRVVGNTYSVFFDEGVNAYDIE